MAKVIIKLSDMKVVTTTIDKIEEVIRELRNIQIQRTPVIQGNGEPKIVTLEPDEFQVTLQGEKVFVMVTSYREVKGDEIS